MKGAHTVEHARDLGRATILATTALLTLLLAAPVSSQDPLPPPSGYGTGLEFVNLSNWPIAGLLERGSYEIDLRMYPGGGVHTFVTLGFLRALNVGFSYGATNVVGRGKVDWNPNVEFHIKTRLIRETMGFPAIALGYGSQGFGPWIGGMDRYTIKSPGFYSVASKNFRFLGELGIHFGANKTREGVDRDLNFFLGLDKSVGPDFYLILEYDTAQNDNEDDELGYGNGYLNFGCKWAASPQLRLEFYFTNLIDNVRERGQSATIDNFVREYEGAGRELRIVYVDWF
jgi:hypothetical protein